MNANSMSITSFISRLASQNQLFPKKQLSQFCKSKNSTCAPQKYKNIFQGYDYQFKRNYQNFKQIILISSISVLKNQLCLIQLILEYIQDLATSKMILVCVEKQQLKIYERFNYLQGFFNMLVPLCLKSKIEKKIMILLKNCNNQGSKYMSINFLVEFLFIQNVFNFLSKDSSNKFQRFIQKTLLKEKAIVFKKHWKNQSESKLLKLNKLVYFRRDVDQQKTYNMIIDKGNLKVQISKNQLPDWVIQAFKKQPTQNSINFEVNKNTKIMEIYTFLIQLQVFLSSPKVEDVDTLIPNPQFIQMIFSKFLQGLQFQERQSNYKYQSNQAISYINEVRNKYQSFSQPYKDILRIELQKIQKKRWKQT